MPKIRALAGLVDEVVVLADGAVPGVLPENCRVRTFRAGHRALRGARFEAALARELPGLRGGAVVAHMCPIYAVLAAPLVRPLRVPLVLWFTHWRASDLLKAAERVSTAVTSVDYRSFPLPSRKLRAIGHGIDLDEFPCSAPRAGPGTRLLALGRYSTAKGLDVAVAAVPLAGDDVELHVHGPALSDDERAHRGELEQLVRELGLEERVTIGDPVPRAEIPALLADTRRAREQHARRRARQGRLRGRGRVPARCSPPTRSSTSSSLPSSASPAGTRARSPIAIRALAALSPEERAALGHTLRERVAESHSVQSWARGILDAAGVS